MTRIYRLASPRAKRQNAPVAQACAEREVLLTTDASAAALSGARSLSIF